MWGSSTGRKLDGGIAVRGEYPSQTEKKTGTRTKVKIKVTSARKSDRSMRKELASGLKHTETYDSIGTGSGAQKHNIEPRSRQYKERKDICIHERDEKQRG